MNRALFILFIILSFTVNANKEVDSLKILYTDATSDSQKVEILLQLTNKVRFYSNEEALKYATQAYQLATEIPYEKALAESIFMLGRLAYSRSEHDSALIYFNQSLQLFNKLNDPNGIGDCFVGIGDYYYFIDNYAESEVNYLKAIDNYRVNDQKLGIANTLISLGDLAYSTDNYIKASKYFQEAFPLYEKVNSTLGMATSINCMADIDFEQKRYDPATKGYRKAINMFEKANDILGISNCLKRLGDIHYFNNNFDSAFYYFDKAQESYSKIGSLMGQAYSIRSRGLSYLKLDSLNKAMNSFEQAFKLFEKIGDRLGVANTYYHYSEVYFARNEYQKAINNALEGLTISTELGSPQVILLCTSVLSKSYEKIGDFKKAYEYERMNRSTYDTIHNEENIRKITQLQMQFDFDQQTKEKELAQMKKDLLQDEKLRQQKTYTTLGIIGGILMLIVAFIFYRNYHQKQKNNELLADKNKIIALKNKDLTDSIEYAKTLQKAILPQKKILYNTFPESFIYYNPRDIVSGDFHWFALVQNHFVVAASDCTGHGVPGAFMSLLGNEYLHQVVNGEFVVSPKQALIEIDQKIKDTLHIYEQHKRAKDGMDLALCSINIETMELEYCGAYNPLYLVRDNELKIFEANKGSVGSFNENELVSHKIQLEKNDILYMFSDGYIDQFGGEKTKKFMKKRFQELILKIHNEPMKSQKDIFHNTIIDWMGENKQIDDMLIIGIKI